MDIKTARKTLENLDFDKKESQVYLALLKIGETTVTKIAKETKIERTLVYYITEKLINRGLVSFKFKNNVKYYSASNPDKILEDIKEKEKSFLKIRPFLNNIIKQPYEQEVKVDIYKEFAGLKTVTSEVFKVGKEFLILGEQGQIQKNYPLYFQQYLRRLKKSNTKEKVIIREDLRGKIWKSKNSEFRYIPKDLLSPTTTLTSGNKVLITIWEKPTFNLLITSKKISDSYRAYFNYLWRIAKK
jgi:sugar-specific transcriptional regulator TrmB